MMPRGELFLMARMEEYFGYDLDPWAVGIVGVGDVRQHAKVGESYSTAHDYGRDWSPEQHAGRIHFIMDSIPDLEYPIVIDCKCERGRVYATPVMMDGWHRYFAHRAKSSIVIPVEFGGRVDLKRYLMGDSDEKPEE